MRKLISLIIGWSMAYYLYLHWASIKSVIGKDIAFFLLIYVVGLGIIHIGGITLKILAFVAAILEPVADKYCYWYENTKFYHYFHKDEIR